MAAQQTIRLDDLEALALMVGFAYESDEATATALHSQLGALFLTHQSPVLMTLQYQICCPPTMEGAAECKALLLWYIYGLDAFYCLDQGVMSRIPEEDMEVAKPPESFIGQETGSYLDTMLSLASIARRITRTIYISAAKRKAVKPQDVEDLYEQLSKWGEESCPSRLRFTGNLNSDTVDRDAMNKTLLHRTVISLLELHCCMEIERCLEIGIQEQASAEGEALELRRIDIPLLIFRQIFCATCAAVPRTGFAAMPNGFYSDKEGTLKLYPDKGLKTLEKAAKVRNTTATAVSHMDTAHRVKQVNERLNA